MIRVDDLSFTYAGTREPAVRRISFRVAPGEIFGFLGPSGAGKSTTQKILIGLLQDFTGSVQVLDRSLTDWGSDFYEHVGVSFEFPNHFLKLTALENLSYFSKLYRGPSRAPATLLELVGLEADGRLLVSQYSKGMKNRLSVARALLHDPALFFLDEPTAGLDPVNAQRIAGLIRAEQQRGKTVFLTTHDMAVADELCDRVAFIVEGAIALVDAPRELKLHHGTRSVRVEYHDAGRLRTRDFPLEALGKNDGFAALLRAHDVETIHSLEATLADVFIDVTGRGLL